MRSALRWAAVGLSAGIVMAAGNASADDKDQYNLFNPTPTDKMRAFNTDRPTKSNVPYTVDAGHIQYEGDLFIYSYDSLTTPDTQITSLTLGNPTLKVGVLNNVDFEVNFSFYNSVRAMTVSNGASSLSQGVGDTFTRIKWNLFGNEGTGPAFALIPYAKFPTAPMAPTGPATTPAPTGSCHAPRTHWATAATVRTRATLLSVVGMRGSIRPPWAVCSDALSPRPCG